MNGRRGAHRACSRADVARTLSAVMALAMVSGLLGGSMAALLARPHPLSLALVVAVALLAGRMLGAGVELRHIWRSWR